MKKIVIEGTFTDFKGNNRPYVVCAVIQNVSGQGAGFIIPEEMNKDSFIRLFFPSVISIGLSVCHEMDLDRYDRRIGIIQAEGRASKLKNCAVIIPMTNYKFAIPSLLELVANEFCRDFETNPGKYIAGYNDSEERYQKRMREESSNK